ncbi:MAG: chromate efflux transporter [Bacillota bacterium]|nr:chromate efflux transporter [Bacillota bacterium]
MEIFLVSLKLGLTSFGGPTAHLGYFHNEYVKKKKWIDETTYGDLVALCQFLPGPASSQVGMGIGMMRAGIFGGILSFLGFTLPSILLLSAFALYIKDKNIVNQGWVSGLKIVAVIIVFQAVMDMAKKLANGKKKGSIAILSAATIFLWSSNGMQLIIITLAGIAGFIFLKEEKDPDQKRFHIPISKRTAMGAFILFLLLLFLPNLALFINNSELELFGKFFRAGSLVFGGGHVVLPLLEKIVVPQGLISKEAFLAGYGAAQAVPGPLFTFSSYLGAVIGGWKQVIWCTLAIFLPAFLLVVSALPFWDYLRHKAGIQGVLLGVNASVVGILLAALYDPLFVNSITSGKNFALGAFLYGLLAIWKLPPWMIVILGAVGGQVLLRN